MDVPPFSPASRASASIGNVSTSGAWNSSVSAVRSSGGKRRRGALGIRQRVRDRDAHVGVAEVRERRAVAEAHERVHDRRRLEHDLDPVVRDAEEEVRLDQLEPLVRERRGVDGDLRPHAPRRMRERLLRRHVAELVARAPAERAAGAGEHERRRPAPASRPSRHWKSAECSLSTGRMRPPPRALRRERELAGRRRGSPCSRARGRRRARAPRASRGCRRSRRRR